MISQCKMKSNLISNYKVISYKTINMSLSILPHFKNQNIVKVIILQVYSYSLNTKIGVIVKQIWDIRYMIDGKTFPKFYEIWTKITPNASYTLIFSLSLCMCSKLKLYVRESMLILYSI
jgi:hypothetical protein